jgi:hypothetical protein
MALGLLVVAELKVNATHRAEGGGLVVAIARCAAEAQSLSVQIKGFLVARLHPVEVGQVTHVPSHVAQTSQLPADPDGLVQMRLGTITLIEQCEYATDAPTSASN